MKISIPFSNSNQKEKNDINTEDLSEFEKILKKIIYEIFNTSHPFEQTINIDDCKYCPFKSICNI
jgi:CRISPR/Cas system-associated exonuclease Cas4 (RecB family)